MKRLHAVTAFAALLLGACASHAPRPEAPAHARGAARAGAGWKDDVTRGQSDRYRAQGDGGPAAPPIDVSKIPEPVPKAEPRSRYGNKASYSVLGRTYRVLPDARGYVERGLASWYGNKFHGYLTSSFEPYDMYAFTAAHKTLPLPSYARVTNLDNGRSVVVRINDRGPFHDDRIIDLSYAAAVRIGVWPKGTARVEVRALVPGEPEPLPARTQTAAAQHATPAVPAQVPSAASPRTAVPPARDAGAGARIYVQLGAFGERVNAERALAAAERAGIDHVGIESVAVAGHTVHRVRVGPLADEDAADALSARIGRLGFAESRVTIER